VHGGERQGTECVLVETAGGRNGRWAKRVHWGTTGHVAWVHVAVGASRGGYVAAFRLGKHAAELVDRLEQPRLSE